MKRENMRTVLCAVMVLIASADICVWAEGHKVIETAQATSEPSAPAATPTPGSPTPPATTSAAPAPAQTAAPEPKLVGIAAWNKLVGNSITGTEEGKTLTEYYAADGTAKSMLDNEISTGTWMLVGEVICFKYADEPKPECYKLEVTGDTATMYDEKGSGTRYQILKGNPKGL
jgi:hypothetical protein